MTSRLCTTKARTFVTGYGCPAYQYSVTEFSVQENDVQPISARHRKVFCCCGLTPSVFVSVHMRSSAHNRGPPDLSFKASESSTPRFTKLIPESPI
jgi:hypothetical protein